MSHPDSKTSLNSHLLLYDAIKLSRSIMDWLVANVHCTTCHLCYRFQDGFELAAQLAHDIYDLYTKDIIFQVSI